MSRVQLALNVSNLDEAIAFYTKLFGTEPAKVRPGYANFAVAEPPLKLVLIEGAEGGTLNHLGVEVESTSLVHAATQRLAETGLATAEESGECCFALQDKVWVTGADGEPWEIYTVLADAETGIGQTRDPSRVLLDRVGGHRRQPGLLLSDLARKALAELVGTALLVASIVGSGIAATQLTEDVGLQLLINTIATIGVLAAVILAVGPVSGAHLNPAVTLVDRWLGGVTNREVAAYLPAQVGGACLGAIVANVMFEESVVELSTKHRASPAHVFAEVVATFGLVLVIYGVVRGGRAAMAPFAVAAYIGGGYFFTSSTSVANPAVAIGRTLSNTFSGIAPASAPAFIAAQLVGAALAGLCALALYPRLRDVAADVVVPHPEPAS